MRTIRHTAAADPDLQSIMEWTLESFGRPAMERYSRLIGRALLDLADDPERPGSQHAVEALFIYHLRHSRTLGRNPHVHRPRHFILFRTTRTHVEILRYLHEAMDLEQHFPEEP
ncbi:MAG: type II toxin-antitoxin system RelE/ParE family toxin [Verrucomicrobia bacterium]|nr:type II toxin-antitoxin system RelE/ParE family toxin [Verrucomicrobiota bacterium]